MRNRLVLTIVLVLALLFAWESAASASIPDIVNDPMIRALVPINELRDMVGYNGNRTYLFLGQNSYELRPGGGWISRVGLMRFRYGNATMIWGPKYIYDLDYKYMEWLFDPAHPERLVYVEDPPYPYTQLGTNSWYLRDKSWWPDFRVTAVDIARLFSLEATAYNSLVPSSERIPLSAPYTVDGVIATDEQLGATILSAVGPITLSAPGKPFDGKILNSTNFGLFTQVWENTQPGNSKEFIDAVNSRLRHELDIATPNEEANAAFALIRALSQHRITMYSRNWANQRALEKLNWAGRSPKLPGDFLHVSDANIGGSVFGKTYRGNKNNMYIRRPIDYDASLTGGNTSASTATVTYYNAGVAGYFNYLSDPNVPRPNYGVLEQAYYRAWSRVWVPSGVTLTSAVYDTSRAHEFRDDPVMGRHYFASWIGEGGLDAGDTQIISFRYTNPSPLAWARNGYIYRLQVQKQPGTEADALDTSFSSPYLFVTGVTGVTPTSRSAHAVRFVGDLRYDKVMDVGLAVGTISWPSRSVVSVGRSVTLGGYASPYHVRPWMYLEIFKLIGRTYRRVALLGTGLRAYSDTTKRFEKSYRAPSRGRYRARARFPALSGSRTFYSGYRYFRTP